MRPAYLRHPHWRSRACCFMHWLKTDGRDLQAEIVATKRQGRVLILFKRFPELRGALKGIVLQVTVKGDLPDAYIFAKDCLALRLEDGSGFFCSFCNPAEWTITPDRAGQYAIHLYEPFRRFVTEELAGAESGRVFQRLPGYALGHGSR